MSARLPSRIERGSAALSAGDPLAAIQLVSGEEGAQALAVRGIALAQLGEHADALELLQRAAQSFEREGQVGFHARALAARAEVLAATRELGEAVRALDRACDGLEAAGDGRNAAWLRLVRARLRILIGDLPRARADVERALGDGQRAGDGALVAAAELARAEACSRELRAAAALEHLARAREALLRPPPGGIARRPNPLFLAEIERQSRGLREPIARLVTQRGEREVSALVIDAVLAGREVALVDALRLRWLGAQEVDLARRGARFELLLALARRWPRGAGADELAGELFDWEADESHRDRLKTTVARLRRDLGGAAALVADGGGWRLELEDGATLALLLPLDGQRTSLIEALLWDGAAWSARSLAAAADRPLRTVQRELGELVDRGRVRALGGSRAMRYALVEERLGFGTQAVWIGVAGW